MCTLKVLRYAFLSGLVLEFMTAVAIALVAVTLGVRLLNGAISFEEAFLVLLLAPEVYTPSARFRSQPALAQEPPLAGESRPIRTRALALATVLQALKLRPNRSLSAGSPRATVACGGTHCAVRISPGSGMDTRAFRMPPAWRLKG